MRETQEKFSDFFDQFNWQGLGHLSHLLIAYTLNPEEKSVDNAKIFVRHDRITLFDFCGVLAVPVSNLEVFCGAEQGGGGGVGHGSKLTDFRGVARKIFVFFQLGKWWAVLRDAQLSRVI